MSDEEFVRRVKEYIPCFYEGIDETGIMSNIILTYPEIDDMILEGKGVMGIPIRVASKIVQMADEVLCLTAPKILRNSSELLN